MFLPIDPFGGSSLLQGEGRAGPGAGGWGWPWGSLEGSRGGGGVGGGQAARQRGARLGNHEGGFKRILSENKRRRRRRCSREQGSKGGQQEQGEGMRGRPQPPLFNRLMMTTFLRGRAEEQLRAVKAADITAFSDYADAVVDASVSPKTMQVWYVLDLVWISQWLEFVFNGSPEPGPVSNWRLLDDNYSVRMDLELKKDYRVVGAGVWKLLYSTYFGGGPPVYFQGTDGLNDPSKWIVDSNSVSFASTLWKNPKRLRQFSKVGMLKPGSITDGGVDGAGAAAAASASAATVAAVTDASKSASSTTAASAIGSSSDRQTAVTEASSSFQVDAESAGDTAKVEPAAEETFSDVVSLSIKLEPHVHTLLCDRKEKVCTAVGKFRERETLSIMATLANGSVIKPPGRCLWYRGKPKKCAKVDDPENAIAWVVIRGGNGSQGQLDGAGVSWQVAAEASGAVSHNTDAKLSERGAATTKSTAAATEAAVSSREKRKHGATGVAAEAAKSATAASTASSTSKEARAKQQQKQNFAATVSPEYVIRAEDEGYWIRGAFVPLFEDGSQGEPIFSKAVGPMEVAPPKAIGLQIVGECRCDSVLKASLRYWGGTQGHSEYWWLRIRNGRRENITDPTPVPNPEIPLLDAINPLDFEKLQGDPCYLVLGQDDVGCTFKAKCRPIRNDGERGEVATSRASEICLEGESHV